MGVTFSNIRQVSLSCHKYFPILQWRSAISFPGCRMECQVPAWRDGMGSSKNHMWFQSVGLRRLGATPRVRARASLARESVLVAEALSSAGLYDNAENDMLFSQALCHAHKRRSRELDNDEAPLRCAAGARFLSAERYGARIRVIATTMVTTAKRNLHMRTF